MSRIPRPIAERFWAKVDRSAGADSCWLWTASRTPHGYGIFQYRQTSGRASRAAWELTNGEIPDGLSVLHRCDNPPCCNPAHLFLGTRAENIADMNAKGRNGQSGKTHCKHGHELTDENTYRIKSHGGIMRRCRICALGRQDETTIVVPHVLDRTPLKLLVCVKGCF